MPPLSPFLRLTFGPSGAGMTRVLPTRVPPPRGRSGARWGCRSAGASVWGWGENQTQQPTAGWGSPALRSHAGRVAESCSRIRFSGASGPPAGPGLCGERLEFPAEPAAWAPRFLGSPSRPSQTYILHAGEETTQKSRAARLRAQAWSAHSHPEYFSIRE